MEPVVIFTSHRLIFLLRTTHSTTDRRLLCGFQRLATYEQTSAQYEYSLAHLFVVGRLSKSLDSINVRRENGPLIPLSGSKNFSRASRGVWVNTCTQCCQWQSKRSGHKGQKVLTDGSIRVNAPAVRGYPVNPTHNPSTPKSDKITQSVCIGGRSKARKICS